jgi:hypothetical protein
MPQCCPVSWTHSCRKGTVYRGTQQPFHFRINQITKLSCFLYKKSWICWFRVVPSYEIKYLIRSAHCMCLYAYYLWVYYLRPSVYYVSMCMCTDNQNVILLLCSHYHFNLFLTDFTRLWRLEVGAGCTMCQFFIWWLVGSALPSRLLVNKSGRQGGTCSWKGLSLSLKRLVRKILF